MARCNNCGCNDADVDWGLCYECFVMENQRTAGALSAVAAMNYRSMGMTEAADSCSQHARQMSDLHEIQQCLERNPNRIEEVMQLLNLKQ